jgi:hypothetical protein
MNGKSKFLNDMKRGCCKPNICSRKRDEYKYLGGYWPEVSDAPDPSLIEWQNLGVGPFSRFIRQVVIYLVCAVIVIVCFAGVVYGMDYSNELRLGSWSEQSCGAFLITKQAA